MKALVVFYSRTGTTKKAALTIAQKIKADLLEILCPSIGQGLIGYLKAGRSALKKELIPIKPNARRYPLAEYDLIIVGTPVWAWTVSSPVRSFLAQNKNRLKRVAFFATQSSSGAEKAFEKMTQIITQKPLATLTLFTQEIVQENFEKPLEHFIKILG